MLKVTAFSVSEGSCCPGPRGSANRLPTREIGRSQNTVKQVGCAARDINVGLARLSPVCGQGDGRIAVIDGSRTANAVVMLRPKR